MFLILYPIFELSLHFVPLYVRCVSRERGVLLLNHFVFLNASTTFFFCSDWEKLFATASDSVLKNIMHLNCVT